MDQEYKKLVTHILENGVTKSDRTGIGTKSVFAYQMRFDLSKGFPAITTKKLAFNAMKAELLWMIEGSTDERRLAEIQHDSRDPSKTTVWTANATSPYWKPYAKYEGDLGDLGYAKMRNFNGTDQLLNVVNSLKTDPNSRRHMITHLDPSTIQNAALPPCHVMHQYYVNDGKLSCMMTQRSCDVGIGAIFNYAYYATLTHMLAQVCGYEVGNLIVSTGDTHIYLNHIDALKEQIRRESYPLPTLWLNPDITDITKFTMDDIKLVNYQHHPSIKMDMAV